MLEMKILLTLTLLSAKLVWKRISACSLLQRAGNLWKEAFKKNPYHQQ